MCKRWRDIKTQGLIVFKLLHASSCSLSCGRLSSKTLSWVLIKFWKSSEVFGIEDANSGQISVKKLLNPFAILFRSKVAMPSIIILLGYC